MTRFAVIFVMLLSLAACASGGLSERDLTATGLMSFNGTVAVYLAQTNTAAANFVPTAVATSTPTAIVTLGPSIEPPTLTPTLFVPTDDRIPVTLNPSVLTDLEAPLRIDVPDGWAYASDALMLPGAEGMSVVPFSLYQGAVTGGQGTIVILWAFENVVPISPSGGGSTMGINLFADGLRLLLFTVIEPECNFSYDETQTFTVGSLNGQGAYFVADDCPGGLPSMRGWFSAMSVNRLNFAFYAYTEPRDALDGPALQELQAILDTVEIDLSLLPTPAPTQPPVTVITLTPEPTLAIPSATAGALPPTSTVITSPTARVLFATATPAP